MTLPVMPVMTLDEIRERDSLLRSMLSVLVEGEDYDPGAGGIFGSDRPSLLQPGAEKLATIFGLSLVSRVSAKVEDFTGAVHGEPTVTYEVTCDALSGDRLVCSGLGVCTSAEPGFRWRWVGVHDVPPGLDTSGYMVQRGDKTEFAFAIERAETTGKFGKPAEYWAEFQTAILEGRAIAGSRATRSGESPTWTIETALVRIPNPDMAVLANTILKRAKKRAAVAAVITAIGGLSAIFTQDTEEETVGPRPERRSAGRAATADNKAPSGSAEPWEHAGGSTAPVTDDGKAPAAAKPRAAEWSATPHIEAMKAPADLLGAAGLLALIWEQCKSNVFHRNGALTKAIVAGAALAATVQEYGTLETAHAKVRQYLSPAQNQEIMAALAEVLTRVYEAQEAADDEAPALLAGELV